MKNPKLRNNLCVLFLFINYLLIDPSRWYCTIIPSILSYVSLSYLYCHHPPPTPQMVSEFPTSDWVSNIVTADIDGDGQTEVVIGCMDRTVMALKVWHLIACHVWSSLLSWFVFWFEILDCHDDNMLFCYLLLSCYLNIILSYQQL